MNPRAKYKSFIAVLSGWAIFFVLNSCEEKLTEAENKKKTDFASRIIYNANIIQRDSGRVNLRFKAPLIEKYELVDSPYVEAKKGIYLEYFDKKKPNVPGKIWADYARLNELRDFYTAKGNVKIRTNEGQLFATQSIYWDRRKKTMFTQDTVYVTDKDGSTLVGTAGMTAKDDFSEYTFYSNTGSFPSKQVPSAGQ
ncbi:LPS export ABC transporter periplasmic protein LptC [Bergeyella sp. RCAD1439]|uniref:LPS export ABC transporter periplasmic protein LptC n=1 Tax=Bergeyella anatis TaxID=3113737 RepID=UPI002E186869|nr:LPS export ABC transporter periplasmic protein LptC [Bergeyella sp. RCAD1439]